jgi:hypothetical protein
MYHVIFNIMVQRSKPPGPRCFTKEEIVNEAMQVLGKSESATLSAVNVVMSPKLKAANQTGAKPGQILSEGGRGDCRGNFSAAGEGYYSLATGPKEAIVKGEKIVGPQRYRLLMRETPLEPLKRPAKILDKEVSAKTQPAKGTVERKPAKAKGKTKARSRKKAAA